MWLISPSASLVFLSPHSPGTWASLVPFQVSNGTPILPTNVHHQNYSINIIGEPLVPAETGNWASQRPGWAPGWMGVGGAELHYRCPQPWMKPAKQHELHNRPLPRPSPPPPVPPHEGHWPWSEDEGWFRGKNKKKKERFRSAVSSPEPGPHIHHPPVSCCVCRTSQSIQILWCIDALMFYCMTL